MPTTAVMMRRPEAKLCIYPQLPRRVAQVRGAIPASGGNLNGRRGDLWPAALRIRWSVRWPERLRCGLRRLHREESPVLLGRRNSLKMVPSGSSVAYVPSR